MIVIAFVLSLLSFNTAQGHLTSDFDVNWGASLINVEIGEVGTRSLESFTTVEIGYNLIFASVDTALNISFSEMASSNFGDLPFTRLAVGPRWYIRGLNGTRVIMGDQVQGKSWKPSPFLGLQAGFSNLSMSSEEGEAANFNFNAAVIDINAELGLETPITNGILLVGQFSYLLSLLSNSEDEATALSYGGLQIFVGIKLTQF